MHVRRQRANRYVPHGQPYVPGERRSAAVASRSEPSPESELERVPDHAVAGAAEVEPQAEFRSEPRSEVAGTAGAYEGPVPLPATPAAYATIEFDEIAPAARPEPERPLDHKPKSVAQAITLLAAPEIVTTEIAAEEFAVPDTPLPEIAGNDAAARQQAPQTSVVVLFGGDPKARLNETPPSAAPAPLPETPTAAGWRAKLKAALAYVSALNNSRWWIMLPLCAALIAMGIVRLHKGPSSTRTKDGMTIAIVSDDLSSIVPALLIDAPRQHLKGDAPRIAELAGLAADASRVRIPSPQNLAAEPPSQSRAASEIAHVGAVPRSGVCTYFAEAAPNVAPVVQPPQAGFGAALADAAEAQVRDFVVYDDEYRTIRYPGGDVRRLYGVCSDVVIRAYRALGIDLQVRVHEARVGSPDRSIAHRRTENLRRYFKRVGASLPITDFAEDYLPGDVVTYDRPQNRGSQDHIAIVSNIRGPSGRPMIVHNRGFGPQIEDALFVDTITGHYRYRGASPANDKTSAGSPDKNATGKTQKRAESDPPAPGSAPVSPPPKL